MPVLDTDMQQVIDKLSSLGGKPIETLDPAEARKQPTPTDAVMQLLVDRDGEAAPEEVGSTESKSIDGVATRIYRPAGHGRGLMDKVKATVGVGDDDESLPVLVYVHGGGWVIADLDVYDAAPRALANRAGCIVVSVDYRMAPEHTFPAAHDDVLAVTRWLMEHAQDIGGDPQRIAIGGESAGGNMATATCLQLAQAHERQPVCQMLIYPVTDLDHKDWSSYQDSADAKPLNVPMLEWFGKHLMNDPTEATDIRLSPLHAPRELLAMLPPALVIMAESDPLRDQGEAYAAALKDAGVAVTNTCYKGTTHEFFGMVAWVSKADEAMTQAASALNDAFVQVPTATR